jgi:hypothetical protein
MIGGDVAEAEAQAQAKCILAQRLACPFRLVWQPHFDSHEIACMHPRKLNKFGTLQSCIEAAQVYSTTRKKSTWPPLQPDHAAQPSPASLSCCMCPSARLPTKHAYPTDHGSRLERLDLGCPEGHVAQCRPSCNGPCVFACVRACVRACV